MCEQVLVCEYALCFSRHRWAETKAFCLRGEQSNRVTMFPFLSLADLSQRTLTRRGGGFHIPSLRTGSGCCLRKGCKARHGGQSSQVYRNSLCPKRGGSRWHRGPVLIQHEVTELSANHSTLDFSVQLLWRVGVSVWPRACQCVYIRGLTGAIWPGLTLTEGFRCRLLILSPNEVTCAVREISWQDVEEKAFIIRSKHIALPKYAACSALRINSS